MDEVARFASRVTRAAPFFPPQVIDCVRHHVPAKRYLCATDPGYFARLSPASVLTLKLQGGPMDAAEVEASQAAQSRGHPARAHLGRRGQGRRPADPALRPLRAAATARGEHGCGG
jgi:hypothetical protein